MWGCLRSFHHFSGEFVGKARTGSTVSCQINAQAMTTAVATCYKLFAGPRPLLSHLPCTSCGPVVSFVIHYKTCSVLFLYNQVFAWLLTVLWNNFAKICEENLPDRLCGSTSMYILYHNHTHNHQHRKRTSIFVNAQRWRSSLSCDIYDQNYN